MGRRRWAALLLGGSEAGRAELRAHSTTGSPSGSHCGQNEFRFGRVSLLPASTVLTAMAMIRNDAQLPSRIGDDGRDRRQGIRCLLDLHSL